MTTLRTSLLIALLLVSSLAALPAAVPVASASPGCTVDEDGTVDCSDLEEEVRRWITCPGPNPLCWNGGP